MVHTCNASTEKAETGHQVFEAFFRYRETSLSYKRPCLKKKEKKEKKEGERNLLNLGPHPPSVPPH